MHTFMTGFKIDDIENGYQLTIHSPMGDQVFDIHNVLMDALVDKMIERLYRLDSITDDHQLEFFEGEDNGL